MFKTESGVHGKSRRELDVVLHIRGSIVKPIVSRKIARDRLIQVFIAFRQTGGGRAVLVSIQAQQKVREGQEIRSAQVFQIGRIVSLRR